jgi:hypothetical protein
MIVQLGQSLLRYDLEGFTKGSPHPWLRGGLWPHVNRSETYEEDIGEQCSLDMMQAEVEDDTETKLMLRRIARVPLYYWYKKQKKESRTAEARNIWESNLMRKLNR